MNILYVTLTQEGRFTLVLDKETGINKGETLIAEFCGGMFGKDLALDTTRKLINNLMVDKAVFIDTINGETSELKV